MTLRKRVSEREAPVSERAEQKTPQELVAMAVEELTDAAGTGRAAILAPSQCRLLLRLLRMRGL